MSKYQGATCRGSYLFGSVCGHCERCKDEMESLRQAGKLSEIRPQNLPKADAYSLLADVRAIVEEMVYPIQYLENEAKKQGGVLNGVMAVQISNDVEFYKSRSRIILQKISEHFS